MEKRSESKCSMLRMSFFTGLLVIFTKYLPQLGSDENTSHYAKGKSLKRMFLEIQCVSVVAIVLSQIWILNHHGIQVIEIINGEDLALPFIYFLGILIGTLWYLRPSYLKVSTTLLAYLLCLYFSLLETSMQMDVMTTPAFLDFLKAHPEHMKIWIPWAIGFAFHMNISVTSVVLAIICLRDMYNYDPIVMPEFSSFTRRIETNRQAGAEPNQATPLYARVGPSCNVNGGYAVSSVAEV